MEGAAAGRNEPCANAGAKVEPVSSIEANQDGIEAVSPWRVAVDDEFLGKLHAHFGPGTCASSLLVGAGKTFCDNSLETMTPDQFKHLRGWDVEAL